MRQFLYSQKCRWESWTSLHVSKCALHDHMDSWQANQLLWNSVRKQKMNYSTQSERVFLRRVTLISAALHKEPCLEGKDSEGVLGGGGFCLFIFLVSFFFLWFSCQINYTDNKSLWYFYFLSPRLKSRNWMEPSSSRLGKPYFWSSKAEISW